jgi:hypothetical protein
VTCRQQITFLDTRDPSGYLIEIQQRFWEPLE